MGATYVDDNEVDAARGATDRGVQAPRPDLRVGAERVRRSADNHIERLQRVVLGLGDLE